MATVFKRGGKKGKGFWYASWTDHAGKRVTKCTRTTDKATAERIAKRHEADAALRRDGVIDPALDSITRESQRSIESHLADYESKLRAASCTDKHVHSTAQFIRKVSSFCGFQTVADITAEGVSRYAGKLRDDGRSARTIQSHLTAMKSFSKWLADNFKLPRDPLSSVKKPSPKTDRRRERRMLLPLEWQKLEAATAAGPERSGMTPRERVLLYRTAIQTGLRSSELRSLTRGRLHLDSDSPFITCKAGTTKNRQAARQYIQPELAASLRVHMGTKAPTAPIFAMPHATNVAGMLKDDLAEARKAWIAEAINNPQEYSQRQQSDFLKDKNHEGEAIDFHSLRHTCGAWLALAGEHPKVIQSVMRHSSITLTMDTYGHLFPGQEADAVGKMRQMMASAAENLQATGTDGRAAESPKGAQRQAQRAERETGRTGATAREAENKAGAEQNLPKPLRIADLSDETQRDATGCESGAGGTRTRNQRIMSPLL